MAHDETDELTVEIGKALIGAVPRYPTLETVCHSQGKSVATVMNWVRRGQRADATELYRRFSAAFLKAESEFAGQCHMQFLELLHDKWGSRSAKILLEMMDRRWKLGVGSDVMAVVKQGPKRTDDLEAMFMQPTARVRALLTKCGWIRPENWEPPVRMLPSPEEEP
jgi:hypothetical protein